MPRLRTRVLGGLLLGLSMLGTALVGACGAKKGALILAINTDMKAPKDVNAVSVTVSTNGEIKDSFIGRVTPDGDVLLPATLAIVEPDDPNATIRVRVMAFQERKPRVLRDVKTTVPRDGRTALLRIPLNFVNDGSTKSAPLPDGVLPPPAAAAGASGAAGFDFLGSFQPDCPDFENQTWIDGECADNSVDTAALPDYDDHLVFGNGKDGADKNGCFDMPTCYANGVVVQGGAATMAGHDAGAIAADAGVGTKTFTPQTVSLDSNACILQLNGADPTHLNVAIVTPDTGECVKPGECYIPIDQGPSGWQVNGGNVQLPKVVCKLLGKGLRLFTSSGPCLAKAETQPICRPAPTAPAGGGLTCLSSCGACVTQHCDSNAIAACFGPDWATGNVTGVCSAFYQCGCSCGGDFTNCKQCDAKNFNDCQTCLNQNLNACANANCSGQCMMGGGGDSGGPATASVHLTLTPGTPAPAPSPGSMFDATMGQFSNPVRGDSAVSASAGDATGGTFKIEWCTGSFTAGKTFTQFSRGPGCTNGNPAIDFSTAAGAHWISGVAVDGQGTLTVMGVSPLYVILQGVRLDADANGKTAGSFTVSGGAQWFNAGP